jgi:peptidyl-prolyl cis-trans isomerase SurA
MRRRLLFLSLLALPLAANAEIVERVVVKVNGEIVTLTDFQARQLRALQQARIAPEQVPAFLREHNARLLQDAIDDLLLKQKAEEEGLRIPPSYLADTVEEIKKENKITSDEQFIELLAREGMTLEDLKRDISNNITKEQVIRRALESKVTATDADARADYEKNQEKYSRPATVTLQEIMVKGESEQARALALRARNGEDFAALARELSEAATKAQGGELGKVAKGELNPDIENVVFSLPAGGVSDPVRSGDAWRIFKVTEKSEGGLLSFEVAKEEIKNRLQMERYGKEYEAYMAEQRKNALIDIRVREVPLQIDQTGRLVQTPDKTPTEPTPPAQPSVGAEDELSTTGSAKPETVEPPK